MSIGANQESFVQVATDGSGKRIRNLSAQLVQPDGSIVTTYMQVLAVADENGNAMEFVEENNWRVMLLDELRAVRMGIQQLLDAGMSPKEQNDLLEMAQDFRATLTEN